jgi:hypothetical protein
MEKLLQAKTVKIPCMRAGLCQYKDERVLVPQETLVKLAQTAYGIPVIIDHQEDETLKAALAQGRLHDLAVGRVADLHYDTDEDLWYAHMVIDTQEAIDLLAKGWGVSTSYEVIEDSEGGTLNAVQYDRTIVAGNYLHLAIVEKPRYEMAVKPVFFNSVDELPCLTIKTAQATIETMQPQKETGMFKLFKTTKHEVKENSDEMMVEVDGEQVAMNALIEAYKNAKKNEVPVEPKDEEVKPNEVEIEIEDDKPNGEVVVPSSSSLRGSADEDKDLDEEVNALLQSVEEEEKKNAEDEEAKAKEEEAKKNRFNSLNNAVDSMDNSVSSFQSLAERAEAGRKKYGSK